MNKNPSDRSRNVCWSLNHLYKDKKNKARSDFSFLLSSLMIVMHTHAEVCSSSKNQRPEARGSGNQTKRCPVPVLQEETGRWRKDLYTFNTDVETSCLV